jgi:hypothetical protein
VAYSAEGDVAKARAEQAALLAAKKNVKKGVKFGNNEELDLVAIAENVLAGEIAVREGKTDEAIASLRAAVQHEDALVDEAKAVAARLSKAWERADVKLSSSCFCLPGI